MLLQKINLKNFRNFDDANFKFNPQATIIIGENSRGKTNLLEGVHFLVNGAGFRESKEDDLTNFNIDKPAMVEGVFQAGDDKTTFTIHLVKNDFGVEKTYQINRARKTHKDYAAYQLRTVLFSPEQIEIIIGPPSTRRDYFNKLISSFDWEYKKKLRNFESALRKRNKILESFHSYKNLDEELAFWNSYLTEHAAYITSARAQYTDYLNTNSGLESKQFRVEYLKSELTEQKLKDNLEKELRIRRTLIGPQKDDFQIYINDKNVHRFGSRSEQRLAVMWLKINEIIYLENFFKKKPILLLDDVFSELDLKNKKLVIKLLKNYQTILTTTESEILTLATVQTSTIEL